LGLDRGLKTFSALRHRNFRLLWTGTLISACGDWIDQIALNWLVIQITDSPVWLGLVNLCRGLPILIFTLIGGAMADRSERRWMMVATQSGAMVLALALAALVYLDLVNIWLVLVVATVRGALASFNLPARHSLISDIVPKADLANAIALHSLTRNVTKVIGPALSGLLIGLVGTAACFAINALTFIAVLVTLVLMDVRTQVHVPPSTGIAASLLEGFHFVWRHETIGVLVMIALVPTFFGQNYITMLTLFAHDVFDWGPEGLGLLTSSAAVGSVMGAFALATYPQLARSGAMMLAFLVAFGVCLIAFATNTWLALAPVLLVGAGAMQIAYSATNNTILQMTVPDAMRGRVLSTLLLSRGLVSLGTATAATLAALFGARAALAGMASLIVILGLIVSFKAGAIRRLEV
jgi:MFS family permease